MRPERVETTSARSRASRMPATGWKLLGCSDFSIVLKPCKQASGLGAKNTPPSCPTGTRWATLLEEWVCSQREKGVSMVNEFYICATVETNCFRTREKSRPGVRLGSSKGTH